MRVINNTDHPIIAFGVHTKLGYGEDVIIEPGQAAEVQGPFLGEMDNGECYVHIEGELICHSHPDDDEGFQVLKGVPLSLQSDNVLAITVRHHEDAPEPYVTHWRMTRPRIVRSQFVL